MSDEDMKKLVNRRGCIKGHLTRFITFLNDNSSKDKITELIARLEKIELIFDEFHQIQSQIEVLSNVDDQINDEREQFDNLFYLHTSTARDIINKNKNSEYTVTNTVSETSLNQPQINVRLPQLVIPEFYGSYDKWTQYFDTFRTLIHENKTLSDIQKYYYLQGSLKGEAAKVIEALEISNANYTIALGLLKERFENKKFIIKTHVKQIFDLPSVNKDSCTSLRHFLDNFLKHYRALQNLKEPVEHWNALLIHLLCTKLDTASKKEWETKSFNVISPDIKSFISFVTERCQLLESLEKGMHNSSSHKSHVHVSTQNSSSMCILCKRDHKLFTCKEFLELSVNDRIDKVRKLKACLNCLYKGHIAEKCKSSSCRKCQKRHNTLLHIDTAVNKTPRTETTATRVSEETVQPIESTIATFATNEQLSILSTALVYLFDKQNNPIKCRALLDSGSQSNFITTELFKKLGLPYQKINLPVAGINSITTNIKRSAHIAMKSVQFSYCFDIPFLIIPTITNNIPQRSFDSTNLAIPENLQLADPTFNTADKVDVLLGSGIFYDLLLMGKIKLGPNKPTLLKSKLGWIIGGPLSDTATSANISICNLSQTGTLENRLEAFWRIEECTSKEIKYSKEETECEQHFQNTVSRDNSGKFVVQLPFKENIHMLGNSLNIATKRFYALERQFEKNPQFKAQYTNFMDEYFKLGHMSVVNNAKDDTKTSYYLPHHGVRKDTSLTTKLRVVFDASARPEHGLALNDVLKVGPHIQQDIFAIILRFRTHPIVFTADVAKMYRCVYMDKEHRQYQRILWRTDPSKELIHYNLNTVTYGTSPASFLATRCLKQLSIENDKHFPKASETIANDFYMDDLISGAATKDSAIRLIKEVSHILDGAGFQLRQWASNNRGILKELFPMGDLETENESQYIIKDINASDKTLGVCWDSLSDVFMYKATFTDHKQYTKRLILSIVSQIYDPLGLIGPVITKAKIILQKLWQLQLSWDDEVVGELQTIWVQFYQNIPKLNELTLARQILISNYASAEIHCFSDASQSAYGACIYIRSTDEKGNILTRLACAKSRVAPLKTISLPRLELCGAVLATQLCNQVLESIDFMVDNIRYWTDSSIVLSWIATEPNQLKTFVSNRVAKIQRWSKTAQWRHVPSEHNPADLISRGMNPHEIKSSVLWFDGPGWLSQEQQYWPREFSPKTSECDVELKPIVLKCTTTPNQLDEFIKRFSSYMKLLRVMAYVQRFIKNCREAKELRQVGSISIQEVEGSSHVIVRDIQSQHFGAEINALEKKNTVPKNSKLATLSPFLDEMGIIRVGGRLKNARLNFNSKHPIVIPSNHHFTTLVIRYEHYRNMHAGAQTVLSSVRQTYWPLRGRSEIRKVLRNCITCFRVNPSSITQKMGDLPAARVVPNRPFLICGVDYAGPYEIKDSKFRNRKFIKSYICVFICFSTKAIHIELVSDLSAEGFLNTLKRFISRRGLCLHIHSDNATNFTGADKILSNYQHSIHDTHVKQFLLENKITWHFIPPKSPHMGGLWEAAVKLTKSHLKRVISNNSFTYEQFSTILTQIEAIVNSRPLIPLTHDPNDLEPLTPGHFLIGAALKTLPEPEVTELRRTYASKYNHLRFIMNQFWSRWSSDYLNTLQQRNKWKWQQEHKLLEGSLVVLKEENIPPACWKMGRILTVHPGSDGVVRVVTVQTTSGCYKRAITKVCLLPVDIDNV